PLRDEAGHLQLLRRQLQERAGVAPAGRLAGGAKLAPRALCPHDGAEALGGLDRGAELFPRIDATALATEVLPVEQPDPRAGRPPRSPPLAARPPRRARSHRRRSRGEPGSSRDASSPTRPGRASPTPRMREARLSPRRRARAGRAPRSGPARSGSPRADARSR